MRKNVIPNVQRCLLVLLSGSFVILFVLLTLDCTSHAAVFYHVVDSSSGTLGYVPDELLVVIRGQNSPGSDQWTDRTANPILNSILDDLGALLVRRVGRRRAGKSSGNKPYYDTSPEIYRVKLPNGTKLDEAVSRIPPYEEIVAIEPNLIYRCYDIPNDSFYVDQWGLRKIDAAAAWSVEQGDTNVIIGIIDTGLDYNHPDLAGNIWINQAEYNGLQGTDDDANGFVDDFYGYDFVTMTSVAPGEDPGPPDNDPMDFHGHGTHVSGIADAVSNNAHGIAGVSWNSRLMALRAGYTASSGYAFLLISDIIDAIYYAIDNGADVLNMSFGGGESAALTLALEDAYQAGLVLVAAAGNAGSDAPSYPAAMPEVIAVSATDSLDQRASWSSFGSWVDVAAPGVDILSTMFDNIYATWSGTSMATPHVVGVVALVLARHPEFTVDQVATAIRSAYDSLSGNDFIGIGRLNAGLVVGINSVGVAKLDQKYSIATLGPGDVTITGTAGGTSYSLFWGQGAYPTVWNAIGSGGSVTQGTLAAFNPSVLPQDGAYSFRLLVTDALGQVSEDRWVFHYDSKLQNGWPKQIGNDWGISVVVADLDGDGTNEIIACSIDGWVHVWNHMGVDKAGWPVKVGGSGVIFATPACADLDLDDDLEIILATATSGICAWHHDGSVVTGWPKTFPWPQRPWAAVSIGNLDSDPEPEIVGSVIDPLALYAWNADGSVLPGWPVTYPDGWWSMSTSALVDIEGDGIDEIVFQRWWSESPNQAAVHLIASNGTDIPGWPVFLTEGAYSSPAVCDLDGNGGLEIIVSAGTQINVFNISGQPVVGWPFNFSASASCASPNAGEVDGDDPFEIGMVTICDDQYLFNHDGSVHPGWPVDPTQVCVITNVLLPSTIIGDVDGDGRNDVVITSLAGSQIWARDQNGAPLPGWPRRIGGYGMYGVLFSTPTLADTDKDGDVEVLCPGADGLLYVWDFQAPYFQTDDGWYALHHDLRNTRYLARKQVQLVEPNGGEVLKAGDTFTIKWEMLAPHAVLNWDLWYSLSGPNGPWVEIAADLPSGADTTGSIHMYDWIIPDTVSSDVLVNIRMDNAGADYTDMSDSSFEIQSQTAVSLSYFYSERRGRSALLFWEVTRAANHKGFHVYRQEPNGPRERITPHLLSGQIRYEFVDEFAPWEKTSYWLQEIESDGSKRWYGPTIIPPSELSKPSLAIRDIHPNPFNPSTTIEYTLPKTGHVRLTIYDVSGRSVKTLVDQDQEQGDQSVDWSGIDDNGKEISSGVYFARLKFGTQVRSRKLMLLK